jgi:hypothetical protein
LSYSDIVKSANLIPKVPFVYREDLRNINNAGLAKTCLTSIKQYIAGVTLPVQIPSQSADYYCTNVASIAGIVLDYYSRTSVAWFRVARLTEIYPKVIPLYRATIRH